MNYIITGGTGFIGTHLTNLLKERYPNAQVYNLDIVKPGTPNPVVKDYKPALREGREGADGLRRGRLVCMAVVILMPGSMGWYFLLLCFLCESIMFPTIFSLSLRHVGVHTKQASSYLVMSIVGALSRRC